MQPMLSPVTIPRKCTHIFYLRSRGYTFVNGSDILFTVKKAPDGDEDDSLALITKSWTVGDTAVYDEDGFLELWLTEADTNIPVGEYTYDLKLITDETGSPLARGPLLVTPMDTLRR